MIQRSVLGCAAALSLAACGGDPLENNITAGEPVTNEASTIVPVAANPIEYVNFVGALDQFEIDAAQLAAQNTTDGQVAELAQRILADHQRSQAELRSAAAEMDPPLTIGGRMTPEQEGWLEELRGLTGADFDRTWLLQQVAAHEKAYALLSDYAENGEEGRLREHASSASQAVYQHLAAARQLAEQKAQQ